MACKNVTFTDFKITFSSTERRAHHHGTTCSRFSQDLLFENFVIESDPRHGISTEQYSMGNVWSNGTMASGIFDTHRNIPSESLRTGLTIHNNGIAGGSYGPRMGARFANWNIKVTNGRNYLIGQAEEMPKGTLAGVCGCEISSKVHPTYGDAECLIESSGTPVLPPNLYQAQRAWRLGNDLPLIEIKAQRFEKRDVEITTSVADSDGTIVRVEFYDGGGKIGESTVSPWTWRLTEPPQGTRSLTARVTDDKGGSTLSEPVAVEVN